MSILGALVILAATKIIDYAVNDVILPEFGIDGGKGEVHEEIMYVDYNGPGIEENGDITAVDFEAYGYKKTFTNEYGDLSDPTFLLAQVSAQYDYTGIPSLEASGIISIYTVSYSKTFKFCGITVEISAAVHIGAIGTGVEMDFEAGTFRIIPPMFGVVPDFSFDID